MEDREYHIHCFIEEVVNTALINGSFRIEKMNTGRWWVGFTASADDQVMQCDAISDDVHEALDDCIRKAEILAEMKARNALTLAGVR